MEKHRYADYVDYLYCVCYWKEGEI